MSCFQSEADGLHICLQRESERDGEGKSTSEKWVLYFETQESRWAGRILNFDLLDELNTPLFSGYAMLPKTKLANDDYYCVSIALSDNDLNTITHGEAVRGIAVAPAEWSARMQQELRDIATDETCPNTLRKHANSILAESEVR